MFTVGSASIGDRGKSLEEPDHLYWNNILGTAGVIAVTMAGVLWFIHAGGSMVMVLTVMGMYIIGAILFQRIKAHSKDSPAMKEYWEYGGVL